MPLPPPLRPPRPKPLFFLFHPLELDDSALAKSCAPATFSLYQLSLLSWCVAAWLQLCFGCFRAYTWPVNRLLFCPLVLVDSAKAVRGGPIGISFLQFGTEFHFILFCIPWCCCTSQPYP
jgi:hypothetical protein